MERSTAIIPTPLGLPDAAAPPCARVHALTNAAEEAGVNAARLEVSAESPVKCMPDLQSTAGSFGKHG
jgi:hypothetical protein